MLKKPWGGDGREPEGNRSGRGGILEVVRMKILVADLWEFMWGKIEDEEGGGEWW